MHRNPALLLMIRTHSRELISDKGWQLSDYGRSDNRYGLGFCVFFAARVVFGFSACKGKGCISRLIVSCVCFVSLFSLHSYLFKFVK
jgi:hypothetical protein